MDIALAVAGLAGEVCCGFELKDVLVLPPLTEPLPVAFTLDFPRSRLRAEAPRILVAGDDALTAVGVTAGKGCWTTPVQGGLFNLGYRSNNKVRV